MIRPDAFTIDGATATDGDWMVAVLAREGEPDGRVYRRITQKVSAGGKVEGTDRAVSLVAELDGVRLYAAGKVLLLTNRKLM